MKEQFVLTFIISHPEDGEFEVVNSMDLTKIKTERMKTTAGAFVGLMLAGVKEKFQVACDIGLLTNSDTEPCNCDECRAELEAEEKPEKENIIH